MKLLFYLLAAILIPLHSMALPSASGKPSEQETCESRGGIWAPYGLASGGKARCNLKTSDGGAPCKGGSECESHACIADENAEIGTKTSGKCYERQIIIGTCMKRVERGMVTPGLCVD